MRKFLNYVSYATLFIGVFTFTACQEEFEELPGENEQETITASSTTAKLVENTVSNDGSFDNIVDGSSCFNIRFPYEVKVNGFRLTIEELEDLDTIEEIFDDLDDDDEDILEIIFPITIILGDFTEVTINGLEDLREWEDQCKEGGDDDDIECIDFVYPITLFTFNVNLEQTGNVTVNSDKEMRRFFAGLDDDDLISIEFPVILELYDDTEIRVNSNAEMAAAIEGAKEACDEDDDDDYNDDDCDDCTTDRLAEVLTGCAVWKVEELERNDNDRGDLYDGYEFSFTSDGKITVVQNGNTFAGTWEANGSGNNISVIIDIADLPDFNLTWKLHEIDTDDVYTEIDFEFGEDNELEFKSYCNGDGNGGDNGNPDVDATVLRELLDECDWIIKRAKNNDEHLNRLLGYEFDFEEGGVVTLSNENTEFQGTWAVTTNEAGRLILAINIGDEPGVSFEWLLSDLKDRRLKFNVEGTLYELVLVRDCDDDDDDDGDVGFLRDLFEDTEWEIALFSENGDDTTEAYNDVTLYIDDDGSLEVKNSNDEVISEGRWFVFRNTEFRLEMIIAFGAGSNFYPLANDYIIVEMDEDRLELKHENDGGGYDQLVLERSIMD